MAFTAIVIAAFVAWRITTRQCNRKRRIGLLITLGFDLQAQKYDAYLVAFSAKYNRESSAESRTDFEYLSGFLERV